MKKYSKALGALLGMATPAGVISVAAFFGLEVPTELAVAIVGVLGAIGTYLAPANAEKQPKGGRGQLEAGCPEPDPELYATAGGKPRADQVEVCEECPGGGGEGCPRVSLQPTSSVSSLELGLPPRRA